MPIPCKNERRESLLLPDSIAYSFRERLKASEEENDTVAGGRFVPVEMVEIGHEA
ncbi:MAG: hypothetical protein KDE19_01920 [Caldilineaceae bacterium]|nr:hypothetical protein [Caldilineaceae bacterium]